MTPKAGNTSASFAYTCTLSFKTKFQNDNVNAGVFPLKDMTLNISVERYLAKREGSDASIRNYMLNNNKPPLNL